MSSPPTAADYVAPAFPRLPHFEERTAAARVPPVRSSSISTTPRGGTRSSACFCRASSSRAARPSRRSTRRCSIATASSSTSASSASNRIRRAARSRFCGPRARSSLRRATPLWLTPQGRFMDVRERPLRLRRWPRRARHARARRRVRSARDRVCVLDRAAPGNPGLLRRADRAERRASVAIAAEWTHVFTETLETTQDELAARSCRRDAAEWRTLNRGKSRRRRYLRRLARLRARMRGEKFVPEHHAEVTR